MKPEEGATDQALAPGREGAPDKKLIYYVKFKPGKQRYRTALLYLFLFKLGGETTTSQILDWAVGDEAFNSQGGDREDLKSVIHYILQKLKKAGDIQSNGQGKNKALWVETKAWKKYLQLEKNGQSDLDSIGLDPMSKKAMVYDLMPSDERGITNAQIIKLLTGNVSFHPKSSKTFTIGHRISTILQSLRKKGLIDSYGHSPTIWKRLDPNEWNDNGADGVDHFAIEDLIQSTKDDSAANNSASTSGYTGRSVSIETADEWQAVVLDVVVENMPNGIGVTEIAERIYVVGTKRWTLSYDVSQNDCDDNTQDAIDWLLEESKIIEAPGIEKKQKTGLYVKA